MKLFSLLVLIVACASIGAEARAQSASATWALSSSTTVTSSTTGQVVGSNEVLNGGPAPAISVFDYAATGQRLWSGTTGWIAGNEEATRFIEFEVTPTSGNNFTVTGVSFEYGAAGIDNTIVSNARYSPDGGTTWLLLNSSPLAYPRAGMVAFSMPLSAAVTGSFKLRIHPWALINSVAGSPTFAVHNSVVIEGTTSPAETCAYLCNSEFEDVSGVPPITTYTQTNEENISCWSTTAADGNIEIWHDGFGSVNAYSGDYFAELNATQTGTLFQTFQAVAGESILVSFAHRGRYSQPDVMTVSIGPDGSGNFANLGTFSDDNSGWGYYSVSYTFPITGTMELRFNSISSNGGAGPADGGNFLDAVSVGCPAGICGVKFNDVDGDGSQGANEPGLPDWQFELSGAVDSTITTDGRGAFCFNGLAPGTYTVSEINQVGWVQTTPAAPGTYTIDLDSGEAIEDLVFGNQLIPTEDCVEPPGGMVGWWPGDGDALDASGFGNNGTLQGGASYGTGHVAGSFSLPALGDHVVVPDAPSLNFGPGQDFSIDAWIKTTDRTNVLHIVDKRDSNVFGVFGYSLFVNGGQLAFQIAETPLGHASYVSTGPTVSDGRWHFVAVTVDRNSKTGLRLFVDNQPVDVFDPTARAGSLVSTMPLHIGTTGITTFGVKPFEGDIDEVELFSRALSDEEVAELYAAGTEGKCKDGEEGDCEQTETVLPLNTGLDHAANGVYSVGGNDAFWTITLDADTSRTTPRPADVITHVTSIWPAAPANSQWIGPSQVEVDNNAIGFEQDDIGLGDYRYALELCIVGETADELTFNLMVLADNNASVWLRLPDGSRLAIGTTAVNGFSAPTPLITTLTGSFVPGTYTLEVDVHNDGISPDFTGMNLTGVVTGANLFLQKHECCNSSGKVTGSKFEDLNGDGVQDKGEGPMAGVIIQLLQGGVVVAQDTTDSAGEYFFDVAPGTYTVTEVVPTGYEQTTPAGGSYTVTVGPGGIVPNLDFGNQIVPCIDASARFLCKRPAGGRYIELTLTNNGPVPASGVTISSLTPGVTFAVTNSPAFPVLPGGTVVVNIDFVGLALGASAQMQISLFGLPDAAGVSETCCIHTITVTRPTKESKFDCYNVIEGGVVFHGNDTARPVDGWVVRLKDAGGRFRTTLTDAAGSFLMESLPIGEFTVSLDLMQGLRVVEPAAGFFQISFKDMESSAENIVFVVDDDFQQTGTEPGEEPLPTDYALGTNYPNPFNPSTVIRYEIPEAGRVRLEVYDMLGRMLTTLVDDVHSPGRFEVVFNAGQLSSGMYIYKISAGSFVETKRMLLVR